MPFPNDCFWLWIQPVDREGRLSADSVEKVGFSDRLSSGTATTGEPTHQFRINRRTPNRAIEIGEVLAQVAQIKTSINAAQKVSGWNVIFKVERVKQSILPTRYLSHHAACIPAGQCRNFAGGQPGSYFFNRIGRLQPIIKWRTSPLALKSGR